MSIKKKIIAPVGEEAPDSSALESTAVPPSELKPDMVAGNDIPEGASSGQYAAVEHHEQVEGEQLESAEELGRKGDFALDIREKTAASFHFSLSTLILLSILILSVLGGVMIAFKSSDVLSEDQQAVTRVATVATPEPVREIPKPIAVDEVDRAEKNSNGSDAQELLTLNFTDEQSATLFLFNKQSSYTFEWNGSPSVESFDFLHLVVDTSDDPDFFGGNAITEVLDRGASSLTFELPESLKDEDGVRAKLCGFKLETRSCAVVSNIVTLKGL